MVRKLTFKKIFFIIIIPLCNERELTSFFLPTIEQLNNHNGLILLSVLSHLEFLQIEVPSLK